MLGKLLTSLGLGQGDLVNVFRQTIDRLQKADFVTEDRRVGHGQAIQTMLDVLQDEGVMAADTKAALMDVLNQWVTKSIPRKK